MTDHDGSLDASEPGAGGRGSAPLTRRTLWIGGSIGVALLILGVWLIVAKLPRMLSAPADSGGTTAAATADTRKIKATVYYIAADGTALAPSTREVLYAAAPADQVRRILEAQIAPPPDGARSPIPAGTTVRNVYLTATGEAYVDVSGAIVSGHTGGSLDEALTVYAIVNAVTSNMPTISAVQLLVEGKQVDSLVGHLDLRYPLPKAPEWVQKGS